ncbi:hypothetical protein BDW66DRAFT_76476 [Aspergillus desertorum]
MGRISVLVEAVLLWCCGSASDVVPQVQRYTGHVICTRGLSSFAQQLHNNMCEVPGTGTEYYAAAIKNLLIPRPLGWHSINVSSVLRDISVLPSHGVSRNDVTYHKFESCRAPPEDALYQSHDTL